jgi:hypothetical protein
MRIAFELFGYSLTPILSKELLGSLSYTEKADHSFLGFNDSTFPFGKVDAKGLCETTHHVEDKHVAGSLPLHTVVLLPFIVLLLFLVLSFIDSAEIKVGSTLQRPEEQGGEPRVFFQGAGSPVASSSLGCSKHLLESKTSNNFPNFLKVFRELYRTSFRRLHLTVAAEHFEGRADTGEDEVGSSDAFLLKALHPVAYTSRQFLEDLAPVAHHIMRSRPTDYVHA